MARVASFTSTGQSLAPRGSLAEMMARRRELADRMAAAQQPVTSWTQGAANLVNIGFAGLQDRQIRQDEATGREHLAQAMAGATSAGGATPEQLEVMSRLDPEVGLTFIRDTIQSRREAAAQARADQQRLEERGWNVADAEKAAQAANANREDQQAFTAGQSQAQQAATAGLQADQQRASAEQARLKAEADAAKAAATPQTDVGKLQADLQAGRIDQPTYDAAMKKATQLAGVGGAENLKTLYGEQDAYINSQSAISQLNRAQQLLEQGIDWGNFAGTRNWAGGAGYAGEAAKAVADRTKEYNSIMNQQAIAAMSQALKGATTDTEMARFIQDMNDPSLDPKIKRTQIDTMLARAQAHQEQQVARIKSMDPNWTPPASKAADPAANDALLQSARDAIAKGADPALVRKRLVDKGVDPGKL